MLAFVHINKTGGTTLKHILRQSFGAAHCDMRLWPKEPRERIKYPPRRLITPADLRRTRMIYPRLRSISGHPVAPFGDLAEAHSEIRFWTFLREPLARAVSHYIQIAVRGGVESTFDEYLHSEQNNWHCRKLCGVPCADEAIRIVRQRLCFVGLLEHFDESLVMLRHFGREPKMDLRYQIRNTTCDPSLKRKLLEDPSTRKMLAAANREDLQLYEFVRSEIYLRQVKQYGPGLAQGVAELREANKTYRPTVQLWDSVKRHVIYRPLLPWCSRGAVHVPFAETQERAA
jgi:hypothetical protein